MKKVFAVMGICLSIIIIIIGCVLFKQWHKDILYGEYVEAVGFIDQKQFETNDMEKIRSAVDYINGMYKRGVSDHENCKTPDAVIVFTTADGKEEKVYIYGDCMLYNDGVSRVSDLYIVSYHTVYSGLARILIE